MISYERMLESQKPEGQRLFNDHLAKYLIGGEYGKRVSDCLGVGLKQIFDPTGERGFGYMGHINYTAARTRIINDSLDKWILEIEGTK